MNMHLKEIFSRSTLLLGILFMMLSSVSFALDAEQQTRAASTEKKTWNLQDADIETVIQQVAKETGKNFILDPRVKGRITIVSSTPIAAEGLYEVFESALQVLGFTTIPSGNVTKIVPDANAKYMAPPLATSRNPGIGDAMVVRVIPVKNVSAPALVPVLRTLVSPQGHLAAYSASNMLIIADKAVTVSRLAQIVARVDTSEVDDMEIISLSHATASEVVNVLKAQVSVRKPGDPASSQVILSADDRSNSVIVSGDKQRRLQIRAIIASLDVRVSGTGNTEVIYLKYQKAEDMVPVLTNVMKSYFGQQRRHDKNLPKVDMTQGNNYNSQRTMNAALSDLSSASSGTAGQNLGRSTQEEQRQAVGAVIGGFGVQAEPNVNALILTAPTGLMRSLKAVIAKLDIRRAQVSVEAIIVELADDVSEDLGIEWRTGGVIKGGFASSATDSAASVIDTVQGALDAGSSLTFQNGLSLGFIRNGSIRGILRALSRDTNSNILATPSLIALDNKQSTIFVGQTVPKKTGDYINDGSSNGSPFQTIGEKEVGLGLSILPQITQDRAVQLTIEQKADTLAAGSTSLLPITTNRSISTTVLVNDSDILVLGGLIRSEETGSDSKVPLLGDLPIIGNVFKSKSTRTQKTNLMVFIRPKILRDNHDSIQVTGSKYNFMRDKILLDSFKDRNSIALRGDHPTLPELEARYKNLALPDPFN